MVPKGWERKPIKELCESIIDCVNKTAKHVDYTTPYKMIRTTNVRHGKVDTENVRYVDEDVYKQWIRRGAPQDGDIIFTREAPVGEAGILEDSEGIFLGQRTMMYRVNPEIANNRFVFYSLMSGYCQKQIEDFSNGGTVAHMRVPDCGEIIINAPPLAEQQKIAKILSTWDNAISTTERLIDNSTQQKKALMQQLLTGKKRLLDESGERFDGKWEQVIFGDVSKLSSKKYNPLKANQCLPCIELEHLDQGSGRIIGSANASELASIKNHFEAGSVLFGKLRPYLRKYARPDFEGVCSTEIWVFKTTSKLLDEYLFHFVQTDKFISEANKSSGSKMPRADWGVISELVIKIPNLKEQQKIATVLTNADKEIELLEQQLADLQQEKKALMQVLLTGKKRVKINE